MELRAFQSRFSTHEACRAHLEALRWSSGVTCPKCGVTDAADRLATRPDIWRCNACRADFRATDGTPMEGTHLPLNAWFLAIYLLATGGKRISSNKLKDRLGVSYKTAWFLGHRVRQMLVDGSATKLTGIVEADETSIGGRKRKRRDDDEDQTGAPSHRGRGRARSTVLVAVERKARAKAKRIASQGIDDISPPIWACISPGATLMTDELPAYNWIGRKLERHLKVHHASEEYVRTDARTGSGVHVNTAACFNRQTKRSIIGVRHWFSAKHCDRYLTEISVRWNHRRASFSVRINHALLSGRRLLWKDLVA